MRDYYAEYFQIAANEVKSLVANSYRSGVDLVWRSEYRSRARMKARILAHLVLAKYPELREEP